MMTKVNLLACLLLGVAIPLLLTGPTPAVSDEQFEVTAVVDVGPINSFDISFDDANIHTLVQAHRDTVHCGTNPATKGGVDVIDTSTNMRITTLCGFHGGTPPERGPNGVIIVDQKEVWAGDGLTGSETSSLKIFDIATGKAVASLDTKGKGRTDELCEAVSHEIVMAANDRDADLFVSFWSTESHQMLGGHPLSFKTASKDNMGVVASGGIEQCKFDPRTGKFLLAIPQPASQPNGGVVVTISPKTFKVEDVFVIDSKTGCTQGPHGLALGPDHQVLLGCGGGSAGSLIIDDRTGKTIFLLPGLTSDEVWYNPGDNHYFLVPSNDVVGALAPVDAATGHPDSTAPAGGSSRVVAADMLKNQVYVVVPAENNSPVCGKLAAQGCIAVYTAKNDDRCLAHGMPVLDHDDGDDPVFMRVRCSDDRDNDSHDHDR
jgi:hypothetical protein